MTEPARSIGKLGFRKWYERRLIESHAWLITCFLCALGIAASLEGLSFRRPDALFTLLFVFVAGLVCWHALKRYRVIMQEITALGFTGFVTHEYSPKAGSDPIAVLTKAIEICDV